MNMDSAQIAQYAQTLANDILVWVGFGTIVGLLAKGIMPGRDPGGPVATMLMGIGGTIMGCGTVSFFVGGARVTPISILGLICGTCGAFMILFFYKMLSGYWFRESGSSPNQGIRAPYSQRRRQYVVREHD